MDDEEDVKKMIEFLKCNKEESVQEFQYEEFINCDGSDVEEIDTNINNIEDPIGDDIIYTNLLPTDISKFNTYDPRNSLKLDERFVIDSCPDAELKHLLLLNRTQNMQLIQLYKKVKDLLIECQRNISEKTEIIKAHVTANKDQTNSTGAWRLAAPYFKDKQLYPSPANADTVRKKNNNELCIYDLLVLPKWSNVECEKLIRAVKLNYNISQQNEVVKSIQKAIKDDNIELIEELQKRKKELKENDNSEIPPLNSNKYINWIRVADIFLKDKHSAFECKSFWHIYLHPHINKATWTPKENAKLKDLVKTYKFQNWDQIARDLGTNRTGFTVCMNYFSNLHDRFKKGEFTHQEDTRLLELVQQYKMGNYIPWTKIVQHFKKRTRSQLHYRYTYYLSQNDKRRGKFTDAEDILLMIIVDKFGKNYKKCCEYLPTRSMVQCKARYSTNLQNSLKKGSFTIEEDKIIMQFVEDHGSKSWTNLTDKLCRSRGQIRQRYSTIKQFLESNPNSSIAAVPRRRYNLKSEEDSFKFLRSIADEYRDNVAIPTLNEIEAVLRIRSKGDDDEDSQEKCVPKSEMRIAETPTNSIDDMLTNFFCYSLKINSTKSSWSLSFNRTVKGVETVLDTLKAKLDIPENFDENMTLDNLDVAILNSLSENKFHKFKYNNCEINDSITDLVPPNLSTVVGLRSLLIKFSHYRSEAKQAMTKFMDGNQRQTSSGIRSVVVNHFLNLPSNVKRDVEADRKLFYKRFHALFKWPAIMTLENPSKEIQSMTKTFNSEDLHLVAPKRTYSRKPNIAPEEPDDPPVKRLKTTQIPSTSSSALPLKLTPVTNKSVIEDLLRDKTKKLFCFDQVKSDGQTKFIIKEVSLPRSKKQIVTNTFNTRENQKLDSEVLKTDLSMVTCKPADSNHEESFQFDTGHSNCVILDTGRITDNEAISTEDSVANDYEDLKKLNMFLRKECHQDKDEDDDLEDLSKLNIFLKTEADDEISDSSFE